MLRKRCKFQRNLTIGTSLLRLLHHLYDISLGKEYSPVSWGRGGIKDIGYSNESDSHLANIIHSDDFFLEAA